MPRISGRSSLTTTSPMRFRPSVRSVSRWFCLPPMPDFFWVTFRRAMSAVPFRGRQVRRRGALSLRAEQRGGGDVLDGQTATSRDLLGTLETLQCSDRGVNDVDGVVRAEGLAQHVVDTGALEHGADRATGDDAGTGCGRAQQHDAGSGLALHRVRDGALDARNLEEALLGLLDTLGDRRGHLLGLAVADADLTVAVTDDHEGGEAEATTTLHDLGHAVDEDHALDVGRLVAAATARLAVATVTAATLRTGHQMFLVSLLVALLIRSSGLPRAHRRP